MCGPTPQKASRARWHRSHPLPGAFDHRAIRLQGLSSGQSTKSRGNSAPDGGHWPTRACPIPCGYRAPPSCCCPCHPERPCHALCLPTIGPKGMCLWAMPKPLPRGPNRHPGWRRALANQPMWRVFHPGKQAAVATVVHCSAPGTLTNVQIPDPSCPPSPRPSSKPSPRCLLVSRLGRSHHRLGSRAT